MSLVERLQYQDDCYNSKMGDWADDKSEEFYIAVKDALHPDLIDSLKVDLATHIAGHYINDGNSKFFDAYQLSSSHAYCYLNSIYGNYEKEVELEFSDYAHEREI